MSRLNRPAYPGLLTERLQLIPLAPSQLRHYLYDVGLLELALGLEISQANLSAPLRRAIGLKLAAREGMVAEQWLWLTYWLIVIRQDKFGAGMVGFKGPPDAWGGVEIGYGIDPAVSRQGYTTEAVAAMIRWAFQSDACRVITADTLRSNVGSRRVLEKVGMSLYQESAGKLCWRLDKESWKCNPNCKLDG